MPQECAFCPSTATQTGEHVWSDWINDILTYRTYEFRRTDPKTLKVNTWTSNELNVKTRVVCGDCNSGWMSQVDQHEAKPVLRHLITNPSKRILPLRWIISLGIFAFKTAVIAEHMGVHGPFFSREQRHSFARTLQVPAGVFMWYATLERQTHGAFKTRYVVPKLSSEKDFRLYVFTYTVGHFALQVVGSKWTANKPEGFGDFPFIEQNLSDSRVSTPFWPIPISHTPTTFIWPPPHYLAEESIDEFANRFGTLRFVS